MPVKKNKIFSGFKDILKGSYSDYTSGSIGKAVLYLSIPMMLEMVMESVFTVVDAYFVGKLGTDALAAVGLTDSVLVIVYSLGMGLSMGTTAMVARRIGEKNNREAAEASAQSILVGVFISIPMALLGIIYAKDILFLMGANESVVESGWGFTAVIFGGNITIMLLFILNAVFRAAGDAIIAMRVLWIANLINIILDPLFIFGIGPFPEWGVTGAAVATTIGRGSGVLIQFYVLFFGRSRIPIKLDYFKINWFLIRRLIRISSGAVFQFIISSASWIVLNRIVAIFGSAALAGYTIAIRIIIFALLPSWGMANAAATLVGQNLGAKKPERAEKSVWITGISNFIFLVSIAVVFIIFPKPLVEIFSSDPQAIHFGAEALRIISYGYGFYAFGMVMIQAFNGAGDTMTPTKINFFSYWLFQIPLAFALAVYLDYQVYGVFWAITIAEGLLTIIAIIVFRRGQWKLKEV